jgi:hypothetical protein
MLYSTSVRSDPYGKWLYYWRDRDWRNQQRIAHCSQRSQADEFGLGLIVITSIHLIFTRAARVWYTSLLQRHQPENWTYECASNYTNVVSPIIFDCQHEIRTRELWISVLLRGGLGISHRRALSPQLCTDLEGAVTRICIPVGIFQ